MEKRIIETNEAGAALLAEFQREVDSVAGMAYEMMVENKTTVLSPVFRSMLAEHAKKLKELSLKVKYHLALDWIH